LGKGSKVDLTNPNIKSPGPNRYTIKGYFDPDSTKGLSFGLGRGVFILSYYIIII